MSQPAIPQVLKIKRFHQLLQATLAKDPGNFAVAPLPSPPHPPLGYRGCSEPGHARPGENGPSPRSPDGG